MKHKLLVLGIIVLAIVASGTIPAGAQTTAAGPYYATPSWDQTLACTALANCPRFIVLSNMNSAAVLDRETGLVWERTPSVTSEGRTRAEAVAECWSANTGGRKGWRLPKMEELMSLADPSNFLNSSLPAGNPFLNVFYEPLAGPGGAIIGFGGQYLAADNFPDSGTLSASVSFKQLQGSGFSSDPNIGGSSASGVWCVRSGTGAPNQQ